MAFAWRRLPRFSLAAQAMMLMTHLIHPTGGFGADSAERAAAESAEVHRQGEKPRPPATSPPPNAIGRVTFQERCERAMREHPPVYVLDENGPMSAEEFERSIRSTCRLHYADYEAARSSAGARRVTCDGCAMRGDWMTCWKATLLGCPVARYEQERDRRLTCEHCLDDGLECPRAARLRCWEFDYIQDRCDRRAADPRLCPPGQAERPPPKPAVGVEFTAYQQRVTQLVRRQWTGGASEGLSATVRLHIAADGTVQGAVLSNGSGDKRFDESVMRAASQVRRLPPPPSRYTAECEQLEITLRP